MSYRAVVEALEEFGITEVYFGPQGIRLHAAADLAGAQAGYAADPDGTDLTGPATGQWRPGWVVIGRDVEVGDPIFVDAGIRELPVYTAMRDTGSWEPQTVSPSLRRFLSSLARLASVSTQNVPLAEPDESTMDDEEELQALQAELVELNGDAEHWEYFFENYAVWLEEAEDRSS